MRDDKRQLEAPWFFRVFQSFLSCAHPNDNQNSTDPCRWLYSKRGIQQSRTSPGSEEVSPGIEFSPTLRPDPGPPPKLPRLSHTSQARPLCRVNTSGSSPSPEHAIVSAPCLCSRQIPRLGMLPTPASNDSKKSTCSSPCKATFSSLPQPESNLLPFVLP